MAYHVPHDDYCYRQKKNNPNIALTADEQSLWTSAKYRYSDMLLLHATFPTTTRHWINVSLMLGQRRRRWANINPILV